ncbi:NAD-dependent deacetylase sirtuin 3 [Paragonimus westermani]|uniref:NAD-dependent deacetylase sirtuin 3 n=1 Tax=Paragonimus westermani TaxID=34504 RepID=A0A5J4P2D0_9TREM|nr:NAD-dependent deacetylase sirtuin 3 [Paragonimus westermani]
MQNSAVSCVCDFHLSPCVHPVAGLPTNKLIEAHGTFLTATCTVCRMKAPSKIVKAAIDLGVVAKCPDCHNVIKPDIVFFGENLPDSFWKYKTDVLNTDLVFVMGTSLEVHPFASVAEEVPDFVPRVLFNRDLVGSFRYQKRQQDLVILGENVSLQTSIYLVFLPFLYIDAFSARFYLIQVVTAVHINCSFCTDMIHLRNSFCIPVRHKQYTGCRHSGNGPISNSIRRLARLLNWDDELEELMTRCEPNTPSKPKKTTSTPKPCSTVSTSGNYSRSFSTSTIAKMLTPARLASRFRALSVATTASAPHAPRCPILTASTAEYVPSKTMLKTDRPPIEPVVTNGRSTSVLGLAAEPKNERSAHCKPIPKDACTVFRQYLFPISGPSDSESCKSGYSFHNSSPDFGHQSDCDKPTASVSSPKVDDEKVLL